MQLQAEGKIRCALLPSSHNQSVTQSVLAFMYQQVLQNQHSLLSVYWHTLLITNTCQPRETLGATGSQQSCLPMLMHLLTKQDWKYRLSEHSILQECSMPNSNHLGDLIWKNKPISMKQKPFIMHTHNIKVWKRKTLNKLFFSFPQKLSCSTVNLAFQFSTF